MDCLNCQAKLKSDFGYCPVCGAKVVHNRLTLKQVGEDLGNQVFNLDNTFFKTFKFLFVQPELVIQSYISGTRKKFMSPIGYFAIAVTLLGVMFFFLRSVYHIDLSPNSFNNRSAPKMDFVYDYQGLLSYLVVPLNALMTWVLFLDRKKLNYTEHLVANAYISGQVSFVQVLVSLPLFGLLDVKYDMFTTVFLVATISYQFFVLKKLFKIGFWSTLLRGCIYLLLFGIVMLLIGMLIIFISLMTGQMSLEEFRPK